MQVETNRTSLSEHEQNGAQELTDTATAHFMRVYLLPYLYGSSVPISRFLGTMDCLLEELMVILHQRQRQILRVMQLYDAKQTKQEDMGSAVMKY